jgi:hypothetical protein
MGQYPPEAAPEPEIALAPAEPPQQAQNPALMSMNVLSGQSPSLVSSEPQSNGTGGTMADQAYAKLVNMDAFDLVKDKAEQKNPFEFASSSSSINNTASLADMKKSSSVSIRSCVLASQNKIRSSNPDTCFALLVFPYSLNRRSPL